jgi:DNA polymerase (family 10)
MTNLEVARILERIAAILQLMGENPFKVRAYSNAAQSIYNLEHDLYDLYNQKRLKEIPGVGKTVQAQIEEILQTGASAYFEDLSSRIPPTVLEMLSIPGLGPKTVVRLYRELGLDNLAALKDAARAGKLRSLAGLGPKTEARILKGIELLQRSAGKHSIGIALPLAEKVRQCLRSGMPEAEVEIVGSLRRGKRLVSDVDILVGCPDLKKVERALASIAGLDIVERDCDRIAGYLPQQIPVEIILVEPAEFFYHLFTSTGSKAHRSRIMEAMTVSPESIRNEDQIYRQQGMSFIPPELREDRGEIEAARQNRLPLLIKGDDIKGDLHIHSNWSDGSENLIDLLAAARARDYEYLAITDHSSSLPITGGLNRERLMTQAQIIANLNRQGGPRLLQGIECDILKDGRLDLSDADLERLDVVIASVHSFFRLDREAQTERLLRAIENPHVDIIGHLTGRLLRKRPGYELDLERVLKAVKTHRKVLEINSHPHRLDIDEGIARQAVGMGIKLAVNSDAHSQREMDLLRYGILTARRGWVEAGDVINTWKLTDIMAYFNS